VSNTNRGHLGLRMNHSLLTLRDWIVSQFSNIINATISVAGGLVKHYVLPAHHGLTWPFMGLAVSPSQVQCTPVTWNSLPPDLSDTSLSAVSFLSQLKTELFIRA